jgi:hypothetical protein
MQNKVITWRAAARIGALGIMAFALSTGAHAAYHHRGEIDSGHFLDVYPSAAGTKLDSCALCHSGGRYPSGGQAVTVGSCQWCHYAYGYDAHGNIDETLNPYGLAYKSTGRSAPALKAIEGLDSDGDGYPNKFEISTLRFPGDGADDPQSVQAPFRVFSRQEIERLPQRTQLMLMNAHKSTDFYAKYTGVFMEELLRASGILPAATHINVYAPDGFSQYHPLNPDPNPLFYHARGDYPAARYYYSEAADTATNKEGWCDYRSLAGSDLTPNAPIENKDGLRMMLAVRRDGAYLDPGVLTPRNKLDGEGPFRVVPPQKNPGPPDQRATAKDQNVVWPFNPGADHNAGYSIRSATIIKVEPLPPGTTDINTLEAGWKYVDEAKIVVYGAVDPLPTIVRKMEDLLAVLDRPARQSSNFLIYRKILRIEVSLAKHLAQYGLHGAALMILSKSALEHVDGCSAAGGRPDPDDWVGDCDLQKGIYWGLQELIVLLGIIG